jgi:hypothetical protein
MKQMNRSQRALQLWSWLVFAARNQQILSYSTVEHLTGIPKVGVGALLGTISHYCKNRKLPWLTSLVVNEETGLPGEGLMESARKEYGDKLDFHGIQSRVFVYDWFKMAVPSTEDFEAAA